MKIERGNFVYYGSDPESPAAKSDLRIGDLILSINGITLETNDDLNKALANCVGFFTFVEVLRGDKILSIKIDIPISESNSRSLN